MISDGQWDSVFGLGLPSLVSKVLERCVRGGKRLSTWIHWREIMHLQPFGSFGPRGLPTRRRKTVGHDLYGYVSLTAFDKANHGCLLQKLHEFGFRGSLLQWFNSYLMGRYQRVTVLGETSDPLPVSSGVPQGSIYSHFRPDVIFHWLGK